MSENTYFVYIMANDHGTIYIGVTGDLQSRVVQHKEGVIEGFTKEYHCHKLVYFEESGQAEEAIVREKALKGWRRERKIELIRKMNPTWFDLYQRL
jgi:putative endonuclease